ncbi:MAG: sensor domain-containing diguanylate cyclase [Clostridia bacterium]|nr:sensor domain-containing diguanylate cyclase [Clostridia bacterium]
MSRPTWARVLAGAVCAAGAGATLLAVHGWRPGPGAMALAAGLFGLALVSDAFSVPLPDTGTLWLGFAISVTSLLLLGVGPAMLIDGTSMALWSAFDTWRTRRRPWYAVAFNAGQATIDVAVGALVAAAWLPRGVDGGHFWANPRVAGYLAAFALGYLLANYALVGTILWLERGEDLLADRRQILFDTALTLVNAIFGLLLIQMYVDGGLGGLLLASLTTLFPLLGLARFYMVLRQAHDELDLYHQTALELSRALDMGAVFRHLAASVRRLIPADWLALWLLDDARQGRFICAVATGSRLEGRTLDSGLPWVQRLLATRRALPLQREELRAILPVADEGAAVPGALVAPLTAGDTVFGFVMLGGVPEGSPARFHPHQSHQLEVLASQAAGAVQNAILYHQLLEAAQTDAMTGLYNYRHFAERLREELERSSRSGQPLALLFIDMDRFKTYNDNFGHLVGDDLLRAVARLIRSSVRESDVPARYAGDEFAVILPGADERAAREAAERIQRALANFAFPVGGRTLVRVSASIGVAVSPQDGRSVDELLRAADSKMYREKGPQAGDALPS